MKDTKILIISLVATFAVIVGLSFVFGSNDSVEPQVSGDFEGIEIIPRPSDWGNVPIDGGIVTKEFEVRNTSGQDLTVRKVATSCMCTEASVVQGNDSTNFFGMEHATDKNPLINFDIKSGETAKVVVKFDPNAHGPQGVGPFERIIWLTFSDPAGVQELAFEGRVVNN